jgi:hypothetical protein
MPRNRITKSALKAILFFSLSLHINAQEYYEYSFVASAVDRFGNSVPYARLGVTTVKGDAGGEPVYVDTADKEGIFHFKVDLSSGTKLERLLYIAGNVPSNTVAFIEPPYHQNNKRILALNKLFSPIKIKVKKNAEVDLGRLPVKILYSPVDVFVQSKNGKPLLTEENNWRTAWFRVKDFKKQIVYEGGLSRNEVERAVNLNESKIKVMMPQGVWWIEVNLSEGSGIWLGQQKPLVIKPGNDTTSLSFKSVR